jgi:hypothetical protein
MESKEPNSLKHFLNVFGVILCMPIAMLYPIYKMFEHLYYFLYIHCYDDNIAKKCKCGNIIDERVTMFGRNIISCIIIFFLIK